ncbi:MAG TPA: FAD-dependent oxidoreductase [Kiritimatiellia bacterium]|nr:FAD-dependent oxidoreductase [Kiritimatiellia bacterium]HMO99278.1 FAD-dependent oxidoreductase [Kiritimatiellia bacterium]
MSSLKPNIAVIGSGVAGITAAHLLQRKYHVTLFEKNKRLGGHTNTIVLEEGPDAGAAVDTGFIVLNDRTYPLLHRLLEEWKCPVRFSDMSFGYFAEENGFYYAGTSLSGLFAQRRNALRPGFYRLLADILRFGRNAIEDLDAGRVGDETLGTYVRNLHPETVRAYIIPMAAAIWSATQRDILNFPAITLLRFWRNHGLLSLKDRPRWQTVVGGSHAYVQSFVRTFTGTITWGSAIRAVRRHADHVEILYADGASQTFSGVVLAAHADESLALLEEPTEEERRLLGAWRYQSNRTLLHTDTSFLPPNRRAWASWNYFDRRDARPDEPVPVTYWMNLLQGLKTERDYLVTLNPDREPAPGALIRDIHYHHPVFDTQAVATQSALPALQGRNQTWYCGSYFGNGFHEDAVRSAVAMAETHGITFPGA